MSKIRRIMLFIAATLSLLGVNTIVRLDKAFAATTWSCDSGKPCAYDIDDNAYGWCVGFGAACGCVGGPHNTLLFTDPIYEDENGAWNICS